MHNSDEKNVNMASFRNNVDIYHVAGNDMQLLLNSTNAFKI